MQGGRFNPEWLLVSSARYSEYYHAAAMRRASLQ